MLTLNKQFLISGCDVTLNWVLPKTKKPLFLWMPISFFFWENYIPIDNTGSRELIVNKEFLIAEIRELGLFGFRTICSLSIPVNFLNLENVTSKIRLENTNMDRNTILRNLNVDVIKGLKINKSNIKINKNNIRIKKRRIFSLIKDLKTVKNIKQPEIINLLAK